MPVQVRRENPSASAAAAPLRSQIEELTICLLEFIRYTFGQMEKPFRVITYLLLHSVTNGAVDFFAVGMGRISPHFFCFLVYVSRLQMHNFVFWLSLVLR